MNPHTLRCLEYHTILELLAELAVSPLGREECLNTRPTNNVDDILESHRQVKEIRELEASEGELPLGEIHDLRPYLQSVRVEGTILAPTAFLEIKKTLHTVNLLYSWKEKCNRFYPNVRRLFSQLTPLNDLYLVLNESISDWGTIKDSASTRLREIRTRLNSLRERINRSFDSLFERKGIGHVFQERIISVRNNRFVVPVRAESKGVIKGIIHDVSQSGATVYMEPLELVSLNNQWSELHQAEKLEEKKILARLTDEVKGKVDQIGENLQVLARIDCTCAKGRFGAIMSGRAPEMSDKIFRLSDAYHPILLLQYMAAKNHDLLPESLKKRLVSSADEKRKVPVPIPISLELIPECRMLIISGPNAGGKTVALKTVGLLALMNQSGIPVPVNEGSQFRVFEKVFVDIGDEQDIQTHLSTFSARVENLKLILESFSDNSLVLLDELGTGTDPAEGAALALAVVDYLKEQGAWTIVTTHYHALKAYGAVNVGIENASVSFDETTGKPTYKLRYGFSGTSNAFDIAMNHGFPALVLEKAKKFMRESEREGYHVLSKLEQLRETTENLQNDLEKELANVRRIKDQVEAERNQIRSRKNEIMENALSRAKDIIKDAEQNFQRLLRELRKEGLQSASRIKHDIAVIKHRTTNELKPEKVHLAEECELRGQVKVGDSVKILTCKKVGKLVRLSRDKKIAEVQAGNMRIKVAPSELIPWNSKKSSVDSRQQKATFFPLPNRVSNEINVVGKTVEEAIKEVDKVIDSAILAGIDKITIIHGHGTGRLRAGIHSYLDSNPQVANFYFPELRLGGRGVTVVQLKE